MDLSALGLSVARLGHDVNQVGHAGPSPVVYLCCASVLGCINCGAPGKQSNTSCDIPWGTIWTDGQFSSLGCPHAASSMYITPTYTV